VAGGRSWLKAVTSNLGETTGHCLSQTDLKHNHSLVLFLKKRVDFDPSIQQQLNSLKRSNFGIYLTMATEKWWFSKYITKQTAPLSSSLSNTLSVVRI
jgi:hypothetical protein